MNKINLFLLLFLGGCGYQMGNLMPPGINSVYVPTFKNTTLFRDFEFILTPAIVDEILVKTSLNALNEYQAQSILMGKIIEVKFSSIIKDENREAELINVTIVCEIEWKDLRTGKNVMEKALVSQNYEINFARGEDFDEETEDGLRDLARKIVYIMETPEWRKEFASTLKK